mgnify:CR=1 FL=1
MHSEDDINRSPKQNCKRFYYIRICDSRDDIKISLEFNKKFLIKFKDGLHVNNDHKSSLLPMIYTLDLEFYINHNKQLIFKHESQEIIANEYRLKCLCADARLQKNIQYEENNVIRHSLNKYFNEEHIFLFDIHFQPIHSFNPSGI